MKTSNGPSTMSPLRVLPLLLMLCSLTLAGLARTLHLRWCTGLRLASGSLLVVPCAALLALSFPAASDRRLVRRTLIAGRILAGYFACTLLIGSAYPVWSISSALLSCGLIAAIVSAEATACLFPARRQAMLAMGLVVHFIVGAVAAVAIWAFESFSDLSRNH